VTTRGEKHCCRLRGVGPRKQRTTPTTPRRVRVLSKPSNDRKVYRSSQLRTLIGAKTRSRMTPTQCRLRSYGEARAPSERGRPRRMNHYGVAPGDDDTDPASRKWPDCVQPIQPQPRRGGPCTTRPPKDLLRSLAGTKCARSKRTPMQNRRPKCRSPHPKSEAPWTERIMRVDGSACSSIKNAHNRHTTWSSVPWAPCETCARQRETFAQ